MTFSLRLTLAASLALSTSAFAQTEEGDAELAKLEETYLDAIKKERSKLGAKYVTALERLKDNLTREGRLEEAMLVKHEVERVQEMLGQEPEVVLPDDGVASSEPVDLVGADATLNGKMRISEANGAIFRWGTRGSSVEWRLTDQVETGKYEVILDYSCAAGEGGAFDVNVGDDQELTGTVSGEGEWSNWRQMHVGDVDIKLPTNLKITATSLANKLLMNVRKLTLAPVGTWAKMQADAIAASEAAADKPAPKEGKTPMPVESAPGTEDGAGFKKLEGAKWSPNSENDADSFFVAHEGNEYHVRLYFVDAPEDNEAMLDDDIHKPKLEQGAKYFGTDPKSFVETGQEALAYAKSVMTGEALDVYVTGEKTRTGGTRYYALVSVDGKLLSHLLVEKGLVSISGPKVDLPNGMSAENYIDALKTLERRAQGSRAGGWGKPRAVSPE